MERLDCTNVLLFTAVTLKTQRSRGVNYIILRAPIHNSISV